MKKAVTALIFVLASTLALALPAPKDIDAAVKAGNLAQAESMLHEVIAAKPGSAKAHYELGQVLAREGKLDAARQALVQAEKIDPALKFATDPLQFRNLMNRVSTANPSPRVGSGEVASHAAPARQAPASGFPWGYVLLGGGVLMIVWLLARRNSSAALATRPAPMGMATAGGSAGGAGQFGGYGAGAPPASPGSGIGGAVLGGVAGLAAGYGLSKMLDSSDGGSHKSSVNDGSAAPLGSPQEDFGAFDAGTGGDWDSGGDASSGDDSW